MIKLQKSVKRRLVLCTAVMMILAVIVTGVAFGAGEAVHHENGFASEDGHTVYYADNRKATGFLDIDGYRYYFQKDTGYMLTGIRTIDGATYYFMTNGRMYRGFKTINGSKHYFDPETGKMAKGLTKIKGNTYYFILSNGRMYKGFKTINGSKHYFDPDTGRMVKGLINIKGNTYYFMTDGRMYKGFKTIDGYKYYFSPDTGRMAKGFTKIGDHTYYFLKSGKMMRSLNKIDGNTYYFDPNNGRMQTGMLKIGRNVRTFNKEGVLIRTVYGDKKAICLTWDDGPSPNTRTIMKVLKDNGARGTFFVVGNRVSSYADTLRDNYNQGNQIGNHSWSHADFSRIDADAVKQQVSDTNSAIKSVIGVKPKIIRTPYGIATSNAKENVGMPIILWSIDTLDWKTQNADSTYNSVINGARDGDVVLMHDLYTQTAEAVKRIVPALKERGFQMVTVEEMALLKGKTLRKGEVYGRIQ